MKKQRHLTLSRTSHSLRTCSDTLVCTLRIGVCVQSATTVVRMCELPKLSTNRILDAPLTDSSSKLAGWLISHADLSTLSSVHKTLVEAKYRLQNAVVLRNLTYLKPVIHNQTLWSGKAAILTRFTCIRAELIEASIDANSEMTVDSTSYFGNKVEKYSKMLNVINAVCKYLQKKGQTLAVCHDDLDIIIQAVEEKKNSASSVSHCCMLSTKYIYQNANIIAIPDFKSGVIKRQRGLLDALTESENMAVECLRLPSTTSQDSVEGLPKSLSMSDRLKKKRKIEGGSDKDID